MAQFPIPTRAEQENFLIRLYFGAGSDYLQLCVDRAYLDFSRTLRGIGMMPNLREAATAEVKKMLAELRYDVQVSSQQAFDAWHRAACIRLRTIYKQNGYDDFNFGQAQKWLNMSLKYIYVIGDKWLPGYDHLYQFCHVPLDRIILQRLQDNYGAPKLSTSWSQIESYEEYLHFQEWIRNTFADSVPLAVEFHLWQEDKMPSQDAK